MPRKEKEEIQPNYEAAKQVSRAAIEMVQQEVYPFTPELRQTLYPDAIIPGGIVLGSKEHASYLMVGCEMDSMRQAGEVYKVARDLQERVGDLSNLHEAPESLLIEVLESRFGPGIKGAMGNPVRTLRENSGRLANKYQGDPRQLRQDTIAETIKAIEKFRQFGPGKAALLMKNYVRFGIWDFSEYEIPIKIDRHVLRISLGTGVINPVKYSEKLASWKDEDMTSKALRKAKHHMIRQGYFTEQDFQDGHIKLIRTSPPFIDALTKAYQQVTRNERISAVELDDALWAIGSYACKKNDAVYCSVACNVHCDERFPSDNNAVWFFVDVDKRKNRIHLFNHNGD